MKHMRSLWGAVMLMALGLFALATPMTAKAQVETIPDLAKDWTVRIGIYVFNQNGTANAAGRIGISGLVERTIYHADKYDVNVGIGYNGFDTIYSIPVEGVIIAHPGNIRFGLGLGYSFNKRPGGSGSNGTAVTLIGGYEFVHGKNPLSAELRYTFIGGSSSELDGLGLTIGIKL